MLFSYKLVYEIDQITGCWLVTSHAPTKGGYIYINRVFKKGYIHRIVFEENIRPILPGEAIRHSCGNKNCINPEHLYVSQHKIPMK